MNDTIAVFASARRHGNTGKLMDWIGGELDIEIIDLSELNLSPYDYEHKNLDDDFVPLVNQLIYYNKIIFASPVYWYAVCGQMKVFLDRTSDLLDLEDLRGIGRKLRGKTGYAVCTSINKEVDDLFLGTFRKTFDYFGMHYGGHVHADCSEDFVQSQYEDDVARFVNSLRSG